jgi:predicted glycosyltransferase
MPILIVTGPFMPEAPRAQIYARATKLPGVSVLTFISGMEKIMMRAVGVIAMGGYNAFSEILSFDKPALIVPRQTPRLEQYIRAERAAELGFATMLVDDGSREPQAMITAIRSLRHQPPPSACGTEALLDGQSSIAARVNHWIGRDEMRTVAGLCSRM